jgi:hypothetical protein
MDVRELRLDNWVYDETLKQPIQVNSLITMSAIADNPYLFKPEPLTDEWLLRFGFVKVFYGFSRNDIAIYDRPEGYIPTIDGTRICKHLLYVHQLQNLIFAIDHEELTLTDEVQR